ncbi:hypothetical protein L2E82_35766 [Cichorium intybus]|uniref:Uncharacterized protein n=1 Tax=Cichorium intybus TaxID=13427 RepID=A0ACB9BPR7_CICIN|nr:hypothetical protein L2E82_35766 [Cichorium intybus]
MLQTAEGPADCGVRLMIEDPLMEAGKYLKLLQRHSPDYLETHLLSFEVNMKKQKILLALQALKFMVQLDAENPDTHRFLLLLLKNSGYLNGPSCCLVYYNYRIAVGAVAVEVLAKSTILKHKMVDQIKREIIFYALRQVEEIFLQYLCYHQSMKTVTC